eukprot:UN06899
MMEIQDSLGSTLDAGIGSNEEGMVRIEKEYMKISDLIDEMLVESSDSDCNESVEMINELIKKVEFLKEDILKEDVAVFDENKKSKRRNLKISKRVK